jgi:hypothetical protein
MIAMPKWTSAAEGEDWAEEDAQAGSGLKEKIREQILAFKASKERGAPAEWAEDDDFIPMNKNAEEDKAAAAAAEEVRTALLLHSCCTVLRLLLRYCCTVVSRFNFVTLLLHCCCTVVKLVSHLQGEGARCVPVEPAAREYESHSTPARRDPGLLRVHEPAPGGKSCFFLANLWL